jgi:hypothetical protein
VKRSERVVKMLASCFTVLLSFDSHFLGLGDQPDIVSLRPLGNAPRLQSPKKANRMMP